MPLKHCFWCGSGFGEKGIFRTAKTFEPICEECFYEYCTEFMMDEFVYTMVDEIQKYYNGSATRWFKNNIIKQCPRCEEKSWVDITIEFYCGFCSYPDPED